MINKKDKPLALVLSGGGVRAMVFHLGILRRLAEQQQLELVRRISTVSGGSLLVGLMLQETNMVWPTSGQFLKHIYPAMRQKLCARSLQWGALRQLRRPNNLRFLLSRANLLALALRHEWGVTSPLNALPPAPEWSINGTTAENGKRFRFKRDSLGDYDLGYTKPGNFSLANAMAVSAAFPGGFGPFCLETAGFQWRKRLTWDAAVEEEVLVDIGYQKLHLYDGGVYDNLGLEPFFDAGKGHPKQATEFIIVSDAGAPLKPGFSLGPLNLFRLKRVADIMSEQSRSLRVRSFMHYVQRAPALGAYLYINAPVAEGAASTNSKYAANFPTTLRRLTLNEFDQISDHGHMIATENLRLA